MKKPVPFGKYYLLERINVGGMAEVFRAKSFGVEGFERLVAVKRILPNIAEDRDFIKMFIDEAKIAVQLNHANIAQIFDLGMVDNAYYIALEHIHGRDLRAIFDRCRQQGEPMTLAQACFVIMKVCEGLDYAHNKRDQNNREIGLVHRDVSPQNVLVSFEGEVKLIDFGIAKAADKSSKTQAGILKGKFGYMSPEQVRGLPIDRRSDIFSCGICLYEMLTGERLFVGESDFSTLEKVRNVEILPPSTYNRKIPDELERIVLKALAKDPDDRYLNAIDLHDELQAFVYTASEFYSRKDLASWMKKTFSKEIEEESAKLESYRQLKPSPDMQAPGGGARTPAPEILQQAPRAATKPPPMGGPSSGRRPTAAMAVVPPPQGQAPPPRPPPVSAQMSAQNDPLAGRQSNPRSTLQMPAVPASGPGPRALSAKPPGAMGNDDSGLSWDDDELETQIYDNPEEEAAAKAAAKAKSKPANGSGGPAAVAALAATQAAPGIEPDLSSLVSTAKGWEAPKLPAPPTSSPSAPTLFNTPGNGHGHGSGNGLASGSNKSQSPFLPGIHPEEHRPEPVFGQGPNRESSAVMRLVDASEPIFDAASSFSAFGSNIAPAKKKSKTGMIILIAATVVFVGAALAVWIAMGGTKPKAGATADETASGSASASGDKVASGSAKTAAGSGSETASGSGTGTGTAVAASGTGTGTGSETAPTGASAGFDLYVTPANVAAWRLDGETKTTPLPARINGLAAGKHTVAIDAPPGYMSESRDVTLAAGEMQKLEIKLSAIEITGLFESVPPGAKVTLMTGGKRIEVGKTPTKAKLDPALHYEVVFEKDGYVSVSRPVQISGQTEEKIEAILEVAKVATGGGKKPDKTDKTDKIDGGKKPDKTDKTDKVDGGGTKPDKVDGGGTKPDKVEKGEGILSLGAKPPCDIYIDGKSLGLKTPQRELKLSAGRHKVTLMNNEFGIKESFTVEIKAGEVSKAVKDFSDRLTTPAPE